MQSIPNTACYESLELSRRILELMQAGDWDEAATLEADRLAMIRQELSSGAGGDIDEKIEALREIEILNSEMESLARQGRSKLSSQLYQITQGRKAGKAYQKHSGY